MEDTDFPVGVWGGNAFPGHEAAVVLCKDGRGLLLFYWDKYLSAPVLDEFTWSLASKDRLALQWLVLHGWVEERQDIEVVPCGRTEVTIVERGADSERTLLLDIGLNEGFDAQLAYVRAPGPFEEEKLQLQSEVKNFVPGQSWILTDDGEWLRSGNA